MFDYDISKLVNSDTESFQRIGWFFYNKNTQDELEDGMSANDVSELLGLLLDEENEIEKEFEEHYQKGLDDGCEF